MKKLEVFAIVFVVLFSIGFAAYRFYNGVSYENLYRFENLARPAMAELA